MRYEDTELRFYAYKDPEGAIHSCLAVSYADAKQYLGPRATVLRYYGHWQLWGDELSRMWAERFPEHAG